VPSLYEGFSLPAVEAMSCEVPLVVTDTGALPEVVGPSGESSLRVPPGDASALAQAIGALLDDEAARRSLGTKGRQRVLDRFTWRNAALATVEEYRKVLDRC
jgi:glycosyltransferase involved in cell wall biosynthesis